MAVIEATEQNLDELLDTEYAVVDFYGDHCGACVFTAPHYRAAADELAFIRFIKFNTSKYPRTAQRFGISALPTFVYFRNGEIVHRSVGGMDRKMIDQQVAVMLYQAD